MHKISDATLARDALRGNNEAMEVLVNRYLKMVYALAYRMALSKEDAEDIAQQVFIKVWKNLKQYDPKKSFKTWILQITHNASIDFLRRKKTIPFSKFEDDEGRNILYETLEDPAPLPPEIFKRKALVEELEAALSTLSPKARAVLHLYYTDGLTFQQIADAMHESINTVKSRHHRALKELRRKLIKK